MSAPNLDLLADIELKHNKHATREAGICLMEAAAWVAGEQHSDSPRCVSRSLGNFGRHLNDALPKSQRQALVTYIPELLHTVNDGLDEARRYVAVDWLVRTWAPAWLDALDDEQTHRAAATLRGILPLANEDAVELARRVAIALRDQILARQAEWPPVRDLGRRSRHPNRCHYGRESMHGWMQAAVIAFRNGQPPAAGGASSAAIASARWVAERVSDATLARMIHEMRVSAISLFGDLIKVPAPFGDI